MRVLHVTEASASGVLGVVQTLADGLYAAGHEVGVALGRRPETPADLLAAFPPDVEVFPLPWERRTLAAQLRARRALARLVGDWRPEVVHLHSAFAGVLGALVPRGGAAVVHSPHGFAFARRADPPPRRAAYRLAEGVVARRCAAVGAVSHAEGRLAREALRAERVVVVPNGIPELDPGRAPPAPERPRPLVVGMGRIGPARRPAESARILAGVADVAAVEWIGAAPAAEDAPLRAAGVPVTGWLPRAAATERLGRAHAYLHWSAWDAQPLAILEALARDVVVVASDLPETRELVGAAQVRATERDAVALLRSVLADPGLREELLRSQRDRRERWGAARMVREWEAVYRRLTGAPEDEPRAEALGSVTSCA